MKESGKWWNGGTIDLVEIEGSVYALHGWNGEKYCDCWKACGEYLTDSSNEIFTLTPIYEIQEEEDFKIIGYDITNGRG